MANGRTPQECMKYLKINYNNAFDLRYELRNNEFVPRWVKCLQLAQKQYPIDDPNRFYGFGTIEEQREKSIAMVSHCVDVINEFKPIIGRKPQSVSDQDTLNYLHSIFEKYHGLLEQQTEAPWDSLPATIRKALADLNVLVHRCESVHQGVFPRHVVTYYGLPKTCKLIKEDYSLFEPYSKFGTVYLNYVEIGKTLEDLAIDNDKYISDDAFKPWHYYSADFNVKFWNDSPDFIEQLNTKIDYYYNSHKEFFEAKGYPRNDYRLVRGNLPLADLINPPNNVLALLEQNPTVTKVTLEE
jgi:hypothetical protein